MAERKKVKVNSLLELRELLEKYNRPAEVFLPISIFNLLMVRTQPTDRKIDNGVSYFMFEGAKIRPPKGWRPVQLSGTLDLSDAEEIDAPS